MSLPYSDGLRYWKSSLNPSWYIFATVAFSVVLQLFLQVFLFLLYNNGVGGGGIKKPSPRSLFYASNVCLLQGETVGGILLK